MRLLNIFHSGVAFIPFTLLVAAIYCTRRAIKIHNSGQQRQDTTPGSPTRGQWFDVPGKYPYSKIGMTWFAVMLWACAIGSFIIIASDYKGV